MQNFAEMFAPNGFRRNSFIPVYGLAEAALVASGGPDSAERVVEHIDHGAALGEDHVVEAAQDCDPGQLPGRGAVFAVKPRWNAAERLVVIQDGGAGGVASPTSVTPRRR